MPVKNSYRKRKPLRNRKRKRSTSALAKLYRMPLGGIPQSRLVRLRYVQTKTYDPPLGGISVNKFSCNSLWDPDFTGVGHQPSNFDHLSIDYREYTVIASRLWVKPVQSASSNSVPGTVITHTSLTGDEIFTTHLAGGMDGVFEQPHMKIQPYETGFGFNSIARPYLMTQSYDAKKYFKLKTVVGNSLHTSPTTNSPIQNIFYEVAYVSPDGANDPGAMDLRVMIDYIVVFTGPKYTQYS